MDKLPTFSFDDYEQLILSLRDNGYRFRLVADKNLSGRTVYLRHDIDLFLDGWETMPQIESRHGVRSTYYVLLSRYNLLSPSGRTVVNDLVQMGHEIGLHYDSLVYPHDASAARRRLEFEVSVLEEITGRKVRTVARHNPHRESCAPVDTSGYIEPYDSVYLQHMIYISDSVRAWRDETLLACFGEHPPDQVMILIHPELWLDGGVTDRLAYLDNVLIKGCTNSDREFLDGTVREIWNNHPAVRQHDERCRQQKDGKISELSDTSVVIL